MDDLDLNYLREADKNLRDTANEDLAWYDYGLDVLKGVGAGVRDAAEETLQFGRDVGNFAEDSANYVLGSEMDFFENNNNRILGEVVRPTTTVGRFTEDLSQFASGFAMGGAYLKAAKAVPKVGKLFKKIDDNRVTSSATKSLLSSTIAHNPYEQRLSDVIESVPVLQNPLTDYLQADDDDGLAERRFKMAAEDLLTTGAFELVFKLAKRVKQGNKPDAKLEKNADGGVEPKATDDTSDEAIEAATQKVQKEQTAKKAKTEKLKAKAQEQRAKVKEATQKGEPTDNIPTKELEEVTARDVHAMASKNQASIEDTINNMNPHDLRVIASNMGVKYSPSTIVGSVSRQNTLRAKVFESVVRKIDEVEVKVPKKGKKSSGIDPAPNKRSHLNKKVVAAQVKAMKNPKDLETLFANRKGALSFLQQRKNGIHSVMEDYTTEMNEVVEGVTQAARPFLNKTRGKQDWEQLQDEVAKRIADNTGVDPDTILKEAHVYGQGVEEAYVRLGVIDSYIHDSGKKLFEIAQNPRFGVDEKVEEMFLVEIEHFNKLIDAAQGITTPLGRGLNARKMAAMSQEDAVLRAKDLGRIMEDTRSALGGKKNIDKVRAAIVASGGDVGKFGKLVNAVGDTRFKKGSAMLGELFRSVILLNFKTFWTNFGSGFLESTLVPIERATGAMIGRGLNTVGITKIDGAAYKQEIAELTGHMAGMFYYGRESFNIAKKSFMLERNYLDPMATKVDGTDTVAKISSDYAGVDANSAAGRMLDTIGKTTRFSLRTLGATDELIKQMNYRASITGEVYAEAAMRGINRNSDEFTELLNKRMDEAFDQNGMATNDKALQNAREVTFTEELRRDTWMGRSAHFIQKTAVKYPVLQLIVPFVRTPTNLISRAAQRTPVIGLLSKRQREMLSGERGAQAQAQAIGRWTLTSAMMMGLYSHFASGNITGAGPSDPKQNKLWRQAGNQPYSIKVGDKFYSYNRVDPLFMPIGAMANLWDNAKYVPTEAQKGLADYAYAVGIAFQRSLEDKAYFRGIVEVMGLFDTTDPMVESNATRFLENYATSFVPVIGQQVYDITSGLTGGEPPHLVEAVTLTDKFMRKLPFLNKELPPQYNWLTGEVIMQSDPFSTGIPSIKDNSANRVANELVELNYGFTGPNRKIEGIELSSEEFSDYKKFMGQTTVGGRTLMQSLELIMKAKWYRHGNSLRKFDGDVVTGDDVEIKAFQKIFEIHRKAARFQLFKAHPELHEKVKQRKILKKLGNNENEQQQGDGTPNPFQQLTQTNR